MDFSNGAFAGLAGVKLDPQEYVLNSGIRLEQTYAHLMAPFMMAYTPAQPSRPHPAPWSAAQGGLAFDIHVQIEIPPAALASLAMDAEHIFWHVTSQLRLRVGPSFILPVIGAQSFQSAKVNHGNAIYYPIETESRLLVLDASARRTITEMDLGWVSKTWLVAARLFDSNASFRLLLEATDQCMFAKHRGLALLWLWGGLESVFSPDKAELKYRISSAIASFLEPPGISRMTAQKEIAKLYDSRSAAAHGRDDKRDDSVQQTYAIARRAVIKMIDEGHVPSKLELEAKLFGADPL